MDVALHLASPPKWRLLAEWRAIGELGTSFAAWPLLAARAPHGDGHPVLVIPGFLASDASTIFTRRYLRSIGYDARGWELGRSLGGIRKTRAALAARLQDIFETTGKRVSVVGWSLGGVMARDLARSHPEFVRYVIGLASPLSRDMRSANTGRLYTNLAKGDVDAETLEGGAPMLASEFDDLIDDLACPSTAMYSRCDGVVNWQTCLVRENERTENLEIIGSSHTGFGVNPLALYAIADRLAQPDGTFTRFAATGPFALAFGAQRRTRDAGRT